MGTLLSCLIALCLFVATASTMAQDAPEAAAPDVPVAETTPAASASQSGTSVSQLDRTLSAFRSRRLSIDVLEVEINALRDQLESTEIPAEREELASELVAKTREKEQLERDMEALATGVDLDGYEEIGGAPADLGTEFEEFLRPIVGQLKAITAEPREIENLRGAVSHHREQIELASEGLTQIAELIDAAQDPAIRAELEILRDQWITRLSRAENDLQVAEFKLTEAQENRSSLLAAAREAMASFFRTRGRNFISAVLTFVLVWFGLRLLYRQVVRFSPLHNQKERSFYLRLIDVAYQAAALLAGIFSALLVLYAASDWVLLGLALIFLAGLAWTGKQAVPHVFEQAKLMLNLGGVREGERLLVDGVPWEVKRINVYTDLKNPALTGGRLRLPLRELVTRHSRPEDPKEPWFPTEESDWVILSDDTYGRVVQQTPEWVTVIKLGGARKVYATGDFLALSPQNLSHNYRIAVTFGIDYQHQAIATKGVPKKFRSRLMEGLQNWVDQEEILNLSVEFAEAGASSLDYAILADFAGSTASKYQKLNRAITRICVDVCNEEGWVIPFTQITLHQAETPAAPEASSQAAARQAPEKDSAP